MGLAFAGPVTFQNVPIISNSGQPVVQVVIGSTAKPADGVSAANIAAAIGNLAYTSVPVTATVNATQAKSVLQVAVSSGATGGGISNPQVWLNESGTASSSGTYAFSALIGSVLNRAVALGAPANTKTLQGSTGSYAYPVSNSLTSSVTASPYYAAASAYGVPSNPLQTTATGGVTFTTGGNGFRATGNGYDNIMQVTGTQLPALLSNSGQYGETETLWLTGFPVFDQGTFSSPVNQFAIANAGGAYQVTFNKPIPILTGSSGVNQPSISLLGSTWTILNYTAPNQAVDTLGGSVVASTDVFGGSLTLAASLVPVTTVYVGHNLTSGPFTVQLTDLGQPNQNGIVPASLAVYYKGTLTNTTSTFPSTGNVRFNVTGNLLTVSVSSTFAGLYQYQKWAKMQLFSNLEPITSGSAWNSTTNQGWSVLLGWTNSTSGTKVSALQTIIVYNNTPVTSLAAGTPFSFIGNPSAYKMTLAGDTLGNNFDAVTAALSYINTVTYQNTQSGSGVGLGNIDSVTEPAQYLTVKSQIPNVFSSSISGDGQTLLYDLTPYQLTEVANSITANGINGGIEYIYANTINPYNGLVSGTYPLHITVWGYATSTSQQATYNVLTVSSLGVTSDSGANPALVPANGVAALSTLYNVTKITLDESIPGLTVYITSNAPTTWNGVGTTNNGVLATLKSIAPEVLVPSTTPRYTYSVQANAAEAYNPQTGSLSTFTLESVASSTSAVPYALFTYNVVENPVPGQPTPNDAMTFEIYNSSSGAGAASVGWLQENYSLSHNNNVTYVSTTNTVVNVKAPFRTERGSTVANIGPTSITLDLAKVVDTLSIQVGTTASNVTTTKYKLYGPYGLDSPTNLANVSIGKVAGTPVLAGSSYTISGINNIDATPSVSSATQPVLLNDLATTPLVVLDSQASAGSNLILIGSGYVNTLSAQLQTAYNVSMTTTTQIEQAYGTNRILIAGYSAAQTTAAANAFIQQLYANAASS